MGAHVEAMAQKGAVTEQAERDQYRGDYVAFGKIHWISFALGGCVGAMLVYAVWAF